MSEQTLPQRPSLLADPEQVALVRRLIHHARMCRAEHATYSMGDGTGKAYGPKEHTWDAGPARLSIEAGHLRYSRHGVVILTAAISHAREVGQLLTAIGAVPVWYSSAYHTGRKDGRWIASVDTNPDRRCRNCGAAGGLKVRYRPPFYTADGWECRDGCQGGAS